VIPFLLGLAIASEVAGTMLLKESDGFTRPWPTLGALACYGVAFWLLALVTRVVPVRIVYAIWSGAGVVLIALAGWLVFRQALDFWALAGMAMIVAGVLAINLLSGSMTH
jgi:small multidrug resistance pump